MTPAWTTYRRALLQARFSCIASAVSVAVLHWSLPLSCRLQPCDTALKPHAPYSACTTVTTWSRTRVQAFRPTSRSSTSSSSGSVISPALPVASATCSVWVVVGAKGNQAVTLTRVVARMVYLEQVGLPNPWTRLCGARCVLKRRKRKQQRKQDGARSVSMKLFG